MKHFSDSYLLKPFQYQSKYDHTSNHFCLIPCVTMFALRGIKVVICDARAQNPSLVAS